MSNHEENPASTPDGDTANSGSHAANAGGPGSDSNDNAAEREQQASARASYNRMSKVYGMLSDDSEKEFVKVALEEVLKPQAGDQVLEPGFGTGQVLLALAEMVGPTGKAYGIDISDGMLAQTTKRLTKADLMDRVDLQLGSATDMPYANDTFDAVFMSFTLELFPDEQIPIVLAECARVLKPEGKLCVACMSKKGKDGAMEKLYEWSHRKFPSFVDCRPIHADEALTSAGFTIGEDRLLSMWGLAVQVITADPPA